MPIILIVEKVGTIRELNVKNYVEADLYKKAEFKSAEDFKCHTSWPVDFGEKKCTISVYGKTKIRAKQENKYEFTPPIDNTLFFGNCVITCKIDDQISDLLAKDWEEIYETLYGGFEDIGDEDSEESSDEDDDLPRTKSGYVKDDFIVDDSDAEEEEEEEDEEEDEDEEEEEIKPSKKKTAKSAKPREKNKTLFDKINTVTLEESASYLDCTEELEEEEYV